MNHKNQWVGEGNVTRDAELKFSHAGKPIGNFSIAVNRSWKQNEEWQKEASFFDVTCFGEYAEMCRDLSKGELVSITGALKQERWQDKETGASRSKVVIIAFHIARVTADGRAGGDSQASSGGPVDHGGGHAEKFEDDSIPW